MSQMRIVGVMVKLKKIVENYKKLVGETGFEPATLWSQTRCATKLRYSPTSKQGIILHISKAQCKSDCDLSQPTV